MRRALATALSLGAAAVPAIAPAEPQQHSRTRHHLMPRTVLDRPLIRMERAEKRRDAERRRTRHAAASAPDVAIPPQLQAIAACESGGDPQAIGGGGQFRGAFQMTYSTWASVGGSGDPAAAAMSEQVRRAALLYAREGASPWPVCGT